MLSGHHHDFIVVVNAGGQYCHLIARRIREAGVRSVIAGVDVTPDELKGARGIIISGGPSSVYAPDAPRFSKAIFEAKLPILGLCYGHQFLANELGGRVQPGKHREYGEVTMEVVGHDSLLQGVGAKETVWMSHGDEVTAVPPDFEILAKTSSCEVAVMANLKSKIFGIQFHPEVNETPCGNTILANFLFHICGCNESWEVEGVLGKLKKEIAVTAGDKRVLFFVSGGVDSTVAFALCTDVLGPERVTGIFVDTGFMRKGERQQIEAAFADRGWHNMRVVAAEAQFLGEVKNVAEPETKRRLIGESFLALQEQMEKECGIESGSWLLGQGTIYPDTIESGGAQNAALIKTHHNRVPAIQKLIEAGLILEPLRDFYKDEVRQIGRLIGLPESLVGKHPFPGPGLAVRCLCSNDTFPVVHSKELHDIAASRHLGGWSIPLQTVGVQGDYRSYSNLVVLTGKASLDEYAAVARRITREIRNYNRVTFMVACRTSDSLDKASVEQKYITKERLDLLREADALCHKMIEEAGYAEKIWQFPVVLLPLTFAGGETIGLRPVSSKDAMTAKFSNLPLEFIHEMGRRLLEIQGIDIVLYDVTDKPPATIEWE